jgi:hypothetical protein
MEEKMNLNEEFLYKEECYIVLLSEKNSILYPEIQELLPGEIYNDRDKVFGTYIVQDYMLLLKDLRVPYKAVYPDIHDITPEKIHGETYSNFLCYYDLLEPLSYSGGIILANKFIKDYGNEEEYPCYCYNEVVELIFENGKLITSIDHSKDMIRIRKNIEKGFRDIHNRRDARCIKRFIRSSFVQDYSNTIIRKKWKQIKNIIRR